MNAKTITHKGQTKTLKEWSREVGISYQAFLYRVKAYGSKKALTMRNKYHGYSRTNEYRIWNAMITRCTSPKHPQYKDYGGRGIKVCKEWKESFESFIDDVGWRPEKGLTLDRIDNNKGYEPGNVRWCSRKTNARNRRNTIIATYQGETKCLSEWAEELGLPNSFLAYRYERYGSFDIPNRQDKYAV